jgi:hypothetical protein
MSEPSPLSIAYVVYKARLLFDSNDSTCSQFWTIERDRQDNRSLHGSGNIVGG